MRLVASALFCGLLSLTAVSAGQAAQPVAAAQAPSVASATAYINNLGKNALGVLQRDESEAQKLQQLEAMFTGEVDIEWVAKFVLGKYWRTATPEQQQRYTENYRVFLVKHYTGKFTEYTSETFKVTSGRDDGNGQYTLAMKIIRPGKEDVNVDYRVRQSEDGRLKIFDIIVEGVSLITTQRSEFASVAGREGIDSLIDRLAKKTAQTEAETQAAIRNK